MSKNHFSIIFIVFYTVIVDAMPLPMEKHSFREYGQIPAYEVSHSKVLFYPQTVSLKYSNQTILTGNDSVSVNRLLFYFSDSVSFDRIRFNFRIRMDQKGNRANDLGWVDPRVKFGYDPDRIVMDWDINDYISLKLGKDRLDWGPLKLGGLLLSDYNRGFTMVHQRYKLGPFDLRGLFCQLNNDLTGIDGQKASQDTSRFFSASRIEYYRKRFGIAAAQSIIYAGKGRSFELEYMLPFYIYHYGQMSNWRYGNCFENTYGSIDFYFWILPEKLKSYGEFFVDDFQGSFDAISQSIQNHIALMLGLDYKVSEKTNVFLEAGQINSFVYNHVIGYRLRYQIDRGFIGSPLGPDQRLFWSGISRNMKKWWDLQAEVWVRQSGQRKIDVPYSDVTDTRDDPIPFGTIETEVITSVENTLWISKTAIDLEAGLMHYRNFSNESGNNNTWPFFSASLSSGITFLNR